MTNAIKMVGSQWKKIPEFSFQQSLAISTLNKPVLLQRSSLSDNDAQVPNPEQKAASLLLPAVFAKKLFEQANTFAEKQPQCQRCPSPKPQTQRRGHTYMPRNDTPSQLVFVLLGSEQKQSTDIC